MNISLNGETPSKDLSVSDVVIGGVMISSAQNYHQLNSNNKRVSNLDPLLLGINSLVDSIGSVEKVN